MSFRPVLPSLFLASLLAAGVRSAEAQAVDPAVVGERLQRLNVATESLEQASASQKRQIDALGNELQRVREEVLRELNARNGQRPWAEDIKRHSDDLKRHSDDLKRLADAIGEVDRKRIADHEQVMKVLGELRKSITTLAETPPPKAAPARPPKEARPAPGKSGEKGETEKPEHPSGAESAPVKAIEYTVGRGEALSVIVEGFNADAKKKGFQTLTIQQVMKFNKITDAKKIREGMKLNLPLYPKTEKP